jgi:hypothetical protein
MAYHAGAAAAERSIAAERIQNDPTWNQTLKTTASPGNGLITHQGELSGNPNSQGFAAEHKVINTFNAQAAATESPFRAVSTESFGGSTSQNSPDIQIIDLRTGDVVDEIQVKSGSHQYVSSSISNDRYGEMHKLHNLEAGSVDSGSSTYTSPDQRIQVGFSQQEARQIARDPPSRAVPRTIPVALCCWGWWIRAEHRNLSTKPGKAACSSTRAALPWLTPQRNSAVSGRS